MKSTAQYWKPVREALERYWKPICDNREGARRQSGMLHLAQALSNSGRRGRNNARHFGSFLHAIVFIIRLARPDGLRSVIAESVLMRNQVLILNRGWRRTSNPRSSDRIIAGRCTLLMRPARVLRSAVVLKPSTLVHFHKMLTNDKYRLLFSST